ncbi:MAG: M43 family zinc metalloprotease [Vicingaceae bacterium]
MSIRPLLFALFVGCVQFIEAQVHDQLSCGSDLRDAYFKNSDADYAERRAEIEAHYAKNETSQKASGIIQIPVVVHVIYRLPEQNISEAQISSQINVINKDYSASNWDTAMIPKIWKPLIADFEMEFVLANRDPDGNPHSGITRTMTTTVDFGVLNGDNHCLASAGGHEIWDRNRYLNVWVCEIAGSYYGFATYPGAPSYCDGIVIDWESFGTNGTASTPTNKGRTLTHEIGHWFDIPHLWGNTSCGDDGISDTPKQEGGNFGCESYPHVTCNNGPHGDMFMNFMDWSDDDCLLFFTKGQKSRAHTALSSQRNSLFNSDGYNGINTISNSPGLNIYPNPAIDQITVNFEEEIEVLSISILSTGGQTLKTIGVNNRCLSQRMDTHNLPPGLYLLKINAQSAIYMDKFMVARP